uniref:PBZ-type domain-containing protein n=1 Tax=Myripristis murdjan TaxID=586833 RepID=A0A668A0E6_9TELE
MPGFELVPVAGGEPIRLPEGETVLGRGPLLGVSDMRVSRRHGLLENLDGRLRLKPIHVNPCFSQSSLDASPEALQRDSWYTLRDGDLFSLLPGRCVYKVTLALFITLILSYQNNNPSRAAKARQGESSRAEVSDESDNFNMEVEEEGDEAETSAGKRNTTTHTAAIRQPDNGDKKTKNGLKASRAESASVPAPSKTRLRTPCPYGKDCYRKNPLHFQECSHPGDSDYEEEEEKEEKEEEEEDAERPECPYGTDCYRKNPLHRKEFKHTKRPGKFPRFFCLLFDLISVLTLGRRTD